MRKENDSLGELEVPAAAYYGIQTLRASRNFPISGLRMHPAMVKSMVAIKKAAAVVNARNGLLDQDKSKAIISACDEILEGKLEEQFIVDVFQMGAGTSFHMNCNEVIANRAEEILGGKKGEYLLVHPNDHVNQGQSTNDVFPTAMRLSLLHLLEGKLYQSLKCIESSFQKKADEFNQIIKSGRTHLQDAAPIRLGQEFRAYSLTFRKGREFLESAARSLNELGIGGSAVGTGMNTLPDFADEMTECLADITGYSLKRAEDLREAMQSMRPMVEVSSALRSIALETNRIANDIRLMASGPHTGLMEIFLPAVAPGSSMMPGKVNPSMLEMVNMVCYQIEGCAHVVSGAAQAGQFELNVMMPVIAFNLNFMIEILSNALDQVNRLCILGIKANAARCLEYAEKTMGLVTALSPIIGYDKAAEVAHESLETGKSLAEVIEEKGYLKREEIEATLDPMKMTEPRTRKKRS
jgi:aspartate ammonia-lyase